MQVAPPPSTPPHETPQRRYDGTAARPVTVWVARGFGTAAHALATLRGSLGDDLPLGRLLASHPRRDSPVLTAADEAFLEPDLVGDAWVAWAVEVCRREQVDLLWVTHEAEAAAAARRAFAAVGTTLLVPPAEALRASRAKSDVYLLAERLGVATPPWERVSGVDEARAAVGRLAGHAPHGLCVKPDTGQGAVGVHRLVADWDDLPVGVDLPTERWLAHLGRHPGRAWLVLPWMPGEEHSVDALLDPAGALVAAAVRTKSDSSRLQRAWHDPDLVGSSAALLSALGVTPLGNAQWREHEGERVLLEVNPRPSGGLYRSSAALGVDLLAAAVRQLLTGHCGITPGTVVDGAVTTTSVQVAVVSPPVGQLPEGGQDVLGGPGTGSSGHGHPVVPDQLQLAMGRPHRGVGSLEQVLVEQAVSRG